MKFQCLLNIFLQGGVAIFVKQHLSVVLMRQVENTQSVTLMLACWDMSLFVFHVYHPSNSQPQIMRDLCKHLTSFNHDKLFLVGDLNLPEIHWQHGFFYPDLNSDITYLSDIAL